MKKKAKWRHLLKWDIKWICFENAEIWGKKNSTEFELTLNTSIFSFVDLTRFKSSFVFNKKDRFLKLQIWPSKIQKCDNQKWLHIVLLCQISVIVQLLNLTVKIAVEVF